MILASVPDPAGGQPWVTSLLLVTLTVLLVLINGFFVAAEFALVKVRPRRLAQLARENRAFAKTARWLSLRLDRALSACQLGITMASLGLGWIGEPTVARLLEPIFLAVGITSAVAIHTSAFIIGFTIITAAHLVIGEQAPKIFAIRRPELMAMWCAVPLKWFYLASYPFIAALNGATTFLLARVGVHGAGEHDVPHNEEEIRALLSQAHAKGELTRTEHRLLDAVFEFDDTISRQILVPRVEVAFVDVEASGDAMLEHIRSTKHSRYPVCEGSLDRVLGVLHVKDLVGLGPEEIDLRGLMRQPRYVPETMGISKLLGHFLASHQHLAFVVDEYGGTTGIVTLEDVLERLVGPVQDEFDMETPDIVPVGGGRYVVDGSIPIAEVSRAFDLELEGGDVDTLGGLIMERLDRVPVEGDRLQLSGAVVEVIEMRSARVTRIRIALEGGSLRPSVF
jgi:CBS domain containing-hemolysin-like protein